MQQKISWLDEIRALACCMVVLLHICSNYVIESSSFNWQLANIFDSFSRVCVPLFFMISGYLFFSEKEVQLKNFIRLFTALAFYSVIALIVLYGQFHNTTHWYFLQQPGFYHLWYFYTLIPLYVVSALIKTRALRLKQIVLLFSLIFVVLNPQTNLLLNTLFDLNCQHNFQIQGQFFYFMLYGVLGGLLRHANIQPSTALASSSLTIYLLASVGTTGLTFYEHLNDADGDFPFYSYDQPLVFIASFSLFLFFMSKNNWSHPAIQLISKNSLAIYGLHAFVLYYLIQYTHYTQHAAFIMIPLLFTFILGISLASSMLLKKIDRKDYVS